MPIVNGLEEEFRGRVAVTRLNAGKSDVRRLQDRYGVRGHPSFVVVDGNGNIEERFFGPQDAAVLRAAMEAVAP